jgi:hypothetical protein
MALVPPWIEPREAGPLRLGDVETVPGRGLKLLGPPPENRRARQGPGRGRLGQSRVADCCPAAVECCLAHRRQAPDLDWTASPAVRAERPLTLFCAVTKAGGLTGEPLSDKPSPAWSSRRPPTPGSIRRASPATSSAFCRNRSSHYHTKPRSRELMRSSTNPISAS